MRIRDSFFTQAKFHKQNLRSHKAKTMQKREHARKSARILIVEDEATTRETFAAILQDCGYKVDTAKEGFEAIEKVRKKPFDIAIIDIVLGELNGVETFEVIRQVNPHIVCIMMTAYSVADMVKEALKKGAYTCIYKPFDIDKTINLIKKICNEKFH